MNKLLYGLILVSGIASARQRNGLYLKQGWWEYLFTLFILRLPKYRTTHS